MDQYQYRIVETAPNGKVLKSVWYDSYPTWVEILALWNMERGVPTAMERRVRQ